MFSHLTDLPDAERSVSPPLARLTDHQGTGSVSSPYARQSSEILKITSKLKLTHQRMAAGIVA
jgi:hypothetical protein